MKSFYPPGNQIVLTQAHTNLHDREAAELKEVIMVLAIFVMSMGIYCQLLRDTSFNSKMTINF
jgi:hypothetical protein